MSNPFEELRNNIARSIEVVPCTIDVLITREFLKTTSRWGIEMQIVKLEDLGAIYYRGETMHIYKKWAKNNL